MIQTPWKGVAVVAAQKLSRESSDYDIMGGKGDKILHLQLVSKHKGVELNLVRGGIIILACARRERKFHPPPLSEFSPPGLLFAPSGHTFSFFSLYIVRMAMSSDGELPPLRSSARGTSPFPPLNMMSDIIQGLSDNLCKNCIFLAT